MIGKTLINALRFAYMKKKSGTEGLSPREVVIYKSAVGQSKEASFRLR